MNEIILAQATETTVTGLGTIGYGIATIGPGLGIGILARMAYDPAVDKNLGMLDAAHLFESSTTRIGIPRKAWLRGYVYAFIELFAPHLNRRIVEAARAGGGTDPGL